MPTPAETTSPAEAVSLPPHLSSEAALKEYLESNGVSTSKFGTGGTKTMSWLFQELKEGSCFLAPSSETSTPGRPQIMRVVEPIFIRLRFRSRVLVQERQQFPDGRTRVRNMLLAEKKEPRDSGGLLAAIHRGIHEELGVSLEDLGREDVIRYRPDTYHFEIEQIDSASYPGLPSSYRTHHVQVEILETGLDVFLHCGLPEFSDFVTKEKTAQGEVTLFWRWDDVPTALRKGARVSEASLVLVRANPLASLRVMSSGSTPAQFAAAAPSSPLGAAGLEATPGVDLAAGTTWASTTTTPGGLDLNSLDGLEPTPAEASASPGILPAEALSRGGARGGLEPDDSPAPSGPPPPAGGSDRGTQTYEDYFIRSFVAGMSVPRLAAVIRALSPEDAANLRAAVVEADATPDQDTAALGEDPPTISWSAPSASPTSGADQPTTDPGPSAPEARAFWEGRDPAPARAPPQPVSDPPLPEAGWDALTSYLVQLDAATGAPPAASALPIRGAAKPKTVAKAPPPPAPQPPPTPEAASSSTARAVVKAPPVLEPEAPSSSTAPPPSTAPTLEPTPPVAAPKKAAPPELRDQEQADDAHRQEFLRRQAFIRQEQAARSRAGLRQLPDNADYDTALASQIEREFAAQRALGPPPAQPIQPRAGSRWWRTHPRPVPNRPVPAATIESPWQNYLRAEAAAEGAASSSSAVPPPPKASFPPPKAGGQGRHGFGSRNREHRTHRRSSDPIQAAWDDFRYPLHEPGASMAATPLPPTLRGWAAGSWESALTLEQAIASGAASPDPQTVTQGVVLRTLPPNVRGGRLPKRPDRHNLDWVGWCFVGCPGACGPCVSRHWAGVLMNTMNATPAVPSSFAELVAQATCAGQAAHLPLLARAGVRNLQGLAVRPANVKRAIAELRGDMLAKTTRGPYESRLKTWNRLAYEGEVSPWPISAHVLEVVGAGFKKGAYRSAKEYFLAAFRHQENDLRIAVDPLLRRLANRIIRSVVRGLPGSRLKEAFPVLALTPLVSLADAEPFDISRPAHSVDVYIIAVWFMLREIEVAAARVGDLVIMRAEVVLDLPIHKTVQGGERTLTRRSLHCACGATTHPLCPLHAARRHMRRMDAAGLLASAAPLFPGTGGGTRSKEDSVHFLNAILRAAGLATTFLDPTGAEKNIFGGHACRVAGATFLAAKGIPLAVIQLLGRWSSRAIERYTQAAPLVLAPGAVARALGSRQAPGAPVSSGDPRRQAEMQLAISDAPPAEEDRRAHGPPSAQLAAQGEGPESPAFECVPDLAPARAVPQGDAGPDHYVYLARTRRVHRPDAQEAMADRAAWRAAGCGWPYGCRQFFRLSAPPPGAALCKRCFPGEAQRQEPESPGPASVHGSSSSESADTRRGREDASSTPLRPVLSSPWLFPLARPAPPLPLIGPAMPGHIAGGYFTVPFVRFGGPADFDVRTSLAGAVYHNGRSPWEMLLSLFGPIIRLDTLPEFAAVARDEDEFLAVLVRPYLEGCRSPGTGSLLRCPAETARHDSWALTKMWQHARRHIDWLQEDSQARAEAWDRTWGLGRLPRRAWHPAWERPNFDTGDEDEDPTVAATILPEQLARILGPRPATREPTEMVPYAEHAAGVHRRDPFYLARLGPWSRVVHRPASPHLDDGIAECGRRVEQRRRALMYWAPPPAERGGLPWRWCVVSWCGRHLSRVDDEVVSELE
ncbi:CLASP [Symbiodinium sp. CCMP2456]|nr:CLASP [Symbiodinium sp. CCMP2456]